MPSAWLSPSARWPRSSTAPATAIVDHRSFVFLGDGCMMEGISHEAASLAGRLGLGKLVAVYDDNGISIDGRVTGWFSRRHAAPFRSLWLAGHLRDVDGHDPAQIDAALHSGPGADRPPQFALLPHHDRPRRARPKPGIRTRTAPRSARRNFVAPAKPCTGPIRRSKFPMMSPPPGTTGRTGAEAEAAWQERFSRYQAALPGTRRRIFPPHRRPASPGTPAPPPKRLTPPSPTRKSRRANPARSRSPPSRPTAPELLGGSADLTHSNLTFHPGSVPITDDPAGNQISFGVREFGMAAIANGIALHGGFIPFVATFLVFSDYARNAIRMSALMRQRVIYVMTHDSIALGEDGPTHQPVEQLASLRLIPNLEVWRPCDTAETICAWHEALRRHDGPTLLALSRQALPPQPRTPERALRHQPRRLCAGAGRHAAGRVARHRFRSRAGHGGRTNPGRTTIFCSAWSRCPASRASRRRMTPIAPASCRRACRSSRWKPAPRPPGAPMPGAMAPPSASTVSANPAPNKAVLEAFGFTPAYVAERIRVLLGHHLNERS